MGAYKENLQIMESDACSVTLRNGDKLIGDMRAWASFYNHGVAVNLASLKAPPLFTWVLIPRQGAKARPRTWNSNGNFSIYAHVVSQFDIVDFTIGKPPKGL